MNYAILLKLRETGQSITVLSSLCHFQRTIGTKNEWYLTEKRFKKLWNRIQISDHAQTTIQIRLQRYNIINAMLGLNYILTKKLCIRGKKYWHSCLAYRIETIFFTMFDICFQTMKRLIILYVYKLLTLLIVSCIFFNVYFCIQSNYLRNNYLKSINKYQIW